MNAILPDVDVAETREISVPVQLDLQYPGRLETEATITVDQLRLYPIAIEGNHFGRPQCTPQEQHVVAQVAVEITNDNVIDIGCRQQ